MSIRSNVDARRLDQRVRFERRVETQNESEGDVQVVWTPLIECAAAVDGAKVSGEPYLGEGIRTVGGYTVWVRADIVKRFAVTPLDRLVWAGRFFDIGDIPDQQLRGRLAACQCTVGKNDG